LKELNIVGFLLLIHLLLGLLTILYFDGTGDAGDSIYHFLYAKYAFSQPELFFDHWAKPIYVLIFSPFSQFDFIGVKILNLIIVNLTFYFTYKLSRKWFSGNAYPPILLMIFCPLYYVLTFSGLTEPLFALLLISALLSYENKHIKTSLIIISLLPFVRSEGLLFILFFAIWLLIEKQWKSIYLLLVGTVFYSIAGFFVYQDLLWVFTKIPYATVDSIYGSGPFFHFFEQLLYVVGIPFYILIWLGLIRLSYQLITKKITLKIYYFLVLGAGMFIVAHSLFWFLGIFNSMGLNRVLICIIPLLAIIASEGLKALIETIKRKQLLLSKVTYGLILISIVLFPFSGNKAAINFEQELTLNTDQLLAKKVAQYIDSKNISYKKIYAAHPYVCKILDVNCFNPNQFEFISIYTAEKLTDQDLIIWENWFSIIEQNVEKIEFDNKENLEMIFEISETNKKGRLVHYAVYRKKY